MNNMDQANVPTPFPEGLIRWAGYREGGVKKPFKAGSGRPTGHAIETPLGARIDTWASEIAADVPAAPTVILLVGGPGNGKTDAVEELVASLDEALGLAGALSSFFQKKFAVSEGQLPPRLAAANFSEIAPGSPTKLRSLSIVQDGTEIDPQRANVAPHLLLLEDLANHLDPQRENIFVCCLNRGILATAATQAHESGDFESVRGLIDQITRAATTAPGAPRCWPLQGYPHIAVWPMDVESILIASVSTTARDSPAKQVLRAAIDAGKWPSVCDAGPLCPFCTSREALDNNPDSLLRVLRNYELASGKRWSFRDLFSLVAYTLAGDYDELTIQGKPYSPCRWAAEQLVISEATTARLSDLKARSLYELVSRLYVHRLFPLWPTLDSAQFDRLTPALKAAQDNQGLAWASDFLKYLRWTGRSRLLTSGDSVPGRVRGELSTLLDPALAAASTVIPLRAGTSCTIKDVEDRFSLSVGEGLSFTSNSITALERTLLSRLAVADSELAGDHIPRIHVPLARQLQAFIRHFSCRLAKRTLCCRAGITLNSQDILAYEECMRDHSKLLRVRKAFGQLLHDDKNQLKVSLVTTFGQPLPRQSRQVNLFADKVQVLSTQKTSGSGRPEDPLPYVRIGTRDIAITFQVFQALDRLQSRHLHPASLPAEVTALIDSIRASAGGPVARDWYRLEDGGYVLAGNHLLRLELANGEFQVSEAIHGQS